MALIPQQNVPPLPKALRGFDKINRYWDRQHEMFAAKILPGEYYVTSKDERIVTVLGSCVSACIRDPHAGIGGMNHFMLPATSVIGHWDEAQYGLVTRYGNVAMEHMINDILKNGGKRSNLEVKLFGGGNVLVNMADVGKKNIDFVRAFVRLEGLRLISEDLGGTLPRKVHYLPQTGKVFVKPIKSTHNATIRDRERKYMQQIETKPTDGEIDLF